MDCAVNLPLGITFSNRLALVVICLSTNHRDLHFRLALLEVNLKRHNRKSLLHAFPLDLDDLLAMEQELSVSPPLVGEVRRLVVWLNVHVHQPHLVVDYTAIAVGEVPFPIEQALDFAADQNHPCLELSEDVIVISSLPVLDRLWSGRLFFGLGFGHIFSLLCQVCTFWEQMAPYLGNF